MKTHLQNNQCNRGMSLVEVTLAIGILAFCAVALMGLLPVLLNTVRESRESAVLARIHQAVAADVRENPDAGNGPWHFTREGLSVEDASEADYRAFVDIEASLSVALGGVTNTSIRAVSLVIENPGREQTSLRRPIFIDHAPDSW